MSAWEGLSPPYRTIVADPPWDYDGKTEPWRSSSTRSYSLMPVAEISALPVSALAANDAHLYLWAVLPLIADARLAVRARHTRRRHHAKKTRVTCRCGLPVNLVPRPAGPAWFCPAHGWRDRDGLTPTTDNRRTP